MSLEDKSIESIQGESAQKRRVYCHFSFKRPKGADYGLFSVAFFNDFDGKKLILHKTRKYKLWQNHQFITAIQSYEHALLSISELQGAMKAGGVSQVMLVTDNSTLAGWIETPKKNKNYAGWMEKAVKMYRVGGPKEILTVSVGLCVPRESEKSYKYCKEENVCNVYIDSSKAGRSEQVYRMDRVDTVSVLDLMGGSIAAPKIESGLRSAELSNSDD